MAGIKRELSELDMTLVVVHKVDHTSFYANCPISKTGFAISGEIDMRASEDYPSCLFCEYKNNPGLCAYARRKAGIPENGRLTNHRLGNNQRPIFASFEINGEEHSVDLEPGRDMGESITDMWDRLLPDSACFLNLRNGRHVKIYKNPREQYKKYGKCYGWISKDGTYYSSNSEEVWGASKSCWMCVWYKKDGKTLKDPKGFKFPI